MLAASWISLIRRLPANLHTGLMLTLTTGAEVVVQRFIKLEPDFAILRGRMAGTQDNGRLVVLPYDQLVAVNLTRALKDSEVDAIFGQSTEAFAPSVAVNAESTEAAQEPAEEAPAADEAPDPAAKRVMPSKADLLKKLRARLGEASRPG